MDKTEIEKYLKNTGIAKRDINECLIFSREPKGCEIKILIPEQGWVSDYLNPCEIMQIYRIRDDSRYRTEIALKKIKELEKEINQLKKECGFDGAY